MTRAPAVAVLIAGLALAASSASAVPKERTGGPNRAAGEVQVMVVGRTATLRGPRALELRAGTVAVGRRRCAVPRGTALAALLATRLKLRVSDQSGCDPSGLFVSKVGPDANHRLGGWEYKVGHADPSFGSGDPAGRLRGAPQLLWYWCIRAGDCERTLAATVSSTASTVTVGVRGYDDTGHGVAVAGATVHYGPHRTALTGADGTATFARIGGLHQLYASKAGLVRSFPVTVGVVA